MLVETARKYQNMSRTRLLIASACVMSVLLQVSAMPGRSLVRTASGPIRPTAGLLALDRGDLRAAAPQLYRYVVLNAWNYPQIPQIRALDPGVKIFVYKDMSSTRSYACHQGEDDRLLPTGVGYCWAARHHRAWFLRDQNGSRLEWRGYGGHWWMDIGNPRYQRVWHSHVVAELSHKGWDGVMVDNAIVDPRDYLQPGKLIPRYPTASAYRAATRSFLKAVGPKVRSAGFGFIPNIGGADASPALLVRWSRYTTGIEREFWSRYGAGQEAPFGGWDWDRQMAQMDAIEAMHKTWFCVTYGSITDLQLMQYAEASFLLAWNGGTGALFYRAEQGVDPWSDAWTTGIGLPLGPRFAVGQAWRRDFSGGTVVVNPSSNNVTVALGTTYLTIDGAEVQTLTLAPTQGVILRSL